MQDDDHLPKRQDPIPDGPPDGPPDQIENNEQRPAQRTLRDHIQARVHRALSEKRTREEPPPARLRTRLILEAARAACWLSAAVITASLFTQMPLRALGVTSGLTVMATCFIISACFIAELHLGPETPAGGSVKTSVRTSGKTSGRTSGRTSGTEAQQARRMNLQEEETGSEHPA